MLHSLTSFPQVPKFFSSFTKESHPREWAIWKALKREKDGLLTREEIHYMCHRFDALEHANVLEDILDRDDKGIDFTTFCKGFDAVMMVRKAAYLKAWHRTAGIGVAGNVAGHMAQAGEDDGCDNAKDQKLPPAIFTFYSPHPHTIDAPQNEVQEQIEHFPVTNDVIEYPKEGGHVQVEPEMGLYVDIVYKPDGSGVERLVPRRIAAFNDCSIRQLEGSVKLSEKKNWGFGSKGISPRSFPVDSISKGTYVDQLCLASYIKRDGQIREYSISAPARNYLLFHDPLLDWLVDRINNQQDCGKWMEIFPTLKNSDFPTSAWIALGAGEYTEWGQKNWLQPKDEAVVIIYDEKIHPNGPTDDIVDHLFNEWVAPKGIIYVHQTFI